MSLNEQLEIQEKLVASFIPFIVAGSMAMTLISVFVGIRIKKRCCKTNETEPNPQKYEEDE